MRRFDDDRFRDGLGVWLRMLAVTTLLAGCGDMFAGDAGTEGARGYVMGDGPIADVVVRVASLDAEGRWQTLAPGAPTDAKGHFVIEAPLPKGPLLFAATAPKDGGSLRALTTGASLREAGGHVVLSPLTEVEAAIADAKRDAGLLPSEAIAHAKKTWQAHVEGVDAAHASSLWALGEGNEERALVVADDAVALHLAAFVRLAAERGRMTGVREAAWASLTRLLVEDVTADGIFDGKGFQGASLSMGALKLDHETLRTTWAELVLEEAEAHAPEPGEGRALWLASAERLANSPVELFATSARDIERAPPMVHIDQSLLFCDPTGRALLSGVVDRPLQTLWLDNLQGHRQAFSAWPKETGVSQEHWFAKEIEAVRPRERFEGTLRATDRRGLSSTQEVSFACEAASLVDAQLAAMRW